MPRDLGPDVTEDVRDGPPPPLEGFAPLAVWLETDYDGGRIAGWVPDVPGVLAVARTRERALSLALTTTGRVRAWLEAHGDEANIPRIWRPDIAGEVATSHEADGYERKVTLPADRRRMTQEEVAAAIRRLGWAREDLLAMAARVAAHEAVHGPLDSDAARGERTSEAVLRHVAGTEVWLLGRMPGGGRFEAALDGPVDAVLASTRGWALERLRTLGLADDGVEVADRHGETWTLAKVLRRLQAHGFDHLWELERRLVRVDGTAGRVRIVTDRRPDTARMVELLRSAPLPALSMCTMTRFTPTPVSPQQRERCLLTIKHTRLN